MEVFFCVFRSNIQYNYFHYHPNCEQLLVSHMCFADDFFSLATAEVGSVGVLKRSLEEFGSMAGLQPNLQKSGVFIAGVSDMVKQDICLVMRMDYKELLELQLNIWEYH